MVVMDIDFQTLKRTEYMLYLCAYVPFLSKVDSLRKLAAEIAALTEALPAAPPCSTSPASYVLAPTDLQRQANIMGKIECVMRKQLEQRGRGGGGGAKKCAAAAQPEMHEMGTSAGGDGTHVPGVFSVFPVLPEQTAEVQVVATCMQAAQEIYKTRQPTQQQVCIICLLIQDHRISFNSQSKVQHIDCNIVQTVVCFKVCVIRFFCCINLSVTAQHNKLQSLELLRTTALTYTTLTSNKISQFTFGRCSGLVCSDVKQVLQFLMVCAISLLCFC